MISEAKKRADARYDKEHTRLLTLKLNKETDADILEWWDSLPNKQGMLKSLMREQIRKGSKLYLIERKEELDGTKLITYMQDSGFFTKEKSKARRWHLRSDAEEMMEMEKDDPVYGKGFMGACTFRIIEE